MGSTVAQQAFSATDIIAIAINAMEQQYNEQIDLMVASKDGSPAYEEAKYTSAVYGALAQAFRKHELPQAVRLDMRHAETRAERDVYHERVDSLEALLMELGKLQLAASQGDASAQARAADLLIPYVAQAMTPAGGTPIQ